MSRITKLRIHGDNILECENALHLLVSALNGGAFELKSVPAYAPVYTIKSDDGKIFEIQLFPGYGRWDFSLSKYVNTLGGPLRESPDALVTRVKTIDDKDVEQSILALEFSKALPAGNNAWQRTGRALTLAYAGIPYLYFTELGGQELDSSREIKAARFPNPLVPFAYAVLSNSSSSMSLPIYTPSSSSNESLIKIFDGCFGINESVQLTREILLSENTKKSLDAIEQKSLKVVKVLSEQRKRSDTLEPKEWLNLFSQQSGIEKAQWLIKKAMPWNKRIGMKTTITLKRLLLATKKSGSVAVGSKEMPICLIPPNKRRTFTAKIKNIYSSRIGKDFEGWLSSDLHPLVCVWIAGFKPRGDDSRPDRGLIPLARMVLGIKDVDLLSIIYGPAKASTWRSLSEDMHALAATNGLWEAIVNLSNGILVDSRTSKKLQNIGFLVSEKKQDIKKTLIQAISDQPNFGEHDIDTVLHLLFSQPPSRNRVYECMCNPPGGDWSGINILETKEKTELRWTSLPRVSIDDSKRPDHLIQLSRERTLLSIESKDTASRLEKKIGPRLIKYTRILLESAPVAVRRLGKNTWKQYKGKKVEKFNFISGGAFRFADEINLRETLIRAQVDIVFGVEFIPMKKNTIIHVITNRTGKQYTECIQELATNIGDFIEVRFYQ